MLIEHSVVHIIASVFNIVNVVALLLMLSIYYEFYLLIFQCVIQTLTSFTAAIC